MTNDDSKRIELEILYGGREASSANLKLCRECTVKMLIEQGFPVNKTTTNQGENRVKCL